MKPKFWTTLSGVLIISGLVFGVTWSEPEKLGNSSAEGALLIDTQGSIWCDVSPNIYKYDDQTSSWVFELESGLPTRSWGGICFDKGDTLWVTWNVWLGLYFSRNYGEGWLDAEEILHFAAPFSSELTADSSEGVWLFFDEDEHTGVFWMNYKDGEWSMPHQFEDVTLTIVLTATTDAFGNVWVAWWRGGYPSSQGKIYTIYFDGESWSDTMTVDSAIGNWPSNAGYEYRRTMDLAPDGYGGIWGVWEYMQLPEDWDCPNDLHTSFWDGESWLVMDTVATDINDPRVAVDEYGNAWVVWEKDGDIWFAINSKGGWSQPARVTEHPSSDDFPDIEVDGHGRVWCAWRRDSAEVYVSYAEGLGIEENDIEVPPSIISVEPIIGSQFVFHTSSGVTSESLDIYDTGGWLVRSLSIGRGAVLWDGSDRQGRMLPPGIYFVRYRGGTADLKRIVLIR